MAKLVVGVNDLFTTHPNLSKEAYGWDPKTVSAGSKKRQKWVCDLSHEWIAQVKDRTNKKSGCPVCSGRQVLPGFNDLQTKYPEIGKQAFNWNSKLISPGSHKKFKWICNLNHKWEASPNHRTTRGDGCPSCSISGFKSNLDGYLYLMFNKKLNMFKVGITNTPSRRLNEHKILGWETIEVIGPKNGNEIKFMEYSILKALRNKGIEFPNKDIQKFNGYTEAWLKSEHNVNSLKDLLSIIK